MLRCRERVSITASLACMRTFRRNVPYPYLVPQTDSEQTVRPIPHRIRKGRRPHCPSLPGGHPQSAHQPRPGQKSPFGQVATLFRSCNPKLVLTCRRGLSPFRLGRFRAAAMGCHFVGGGQKKKEHNTAPCARGKGAKTTGWGELATASGKSA